MVVVPDLSAGGHVRWFAGRAVEPERSPRFQSLPGPKPVLGAGRLGPRSAVGGAHRGTVRLAGARPSGACPPAPRSARRAPSASRQPCRVAPASSSRSTRTTAGPLGLRALRGTAGAQGRRRQPPARGCRRGRPRHQPPRLRNVPAPARGRPRAPPRSRPNPYPLQRGSYRSFPSMGKSGSSRVPDFPQPVHPQRRRPHAR